jgi:uncharacterized protein YeaO (DUF488 family)
LLAFHTRRYPGRVSAACRVRVVRVYEEVGPDDGERVVVDRIWPRGFRKGDSRIGTWYKDVAPSKELREWYHHRPERFAEFASRYEAELHGSPALEELHKLTKRATVTLVTATRQVEGSHAAVLAKLLKNR